MTCYCISFFNKLCCKPIASYVANTTVKTCSSMCALFVTISAAFHTVVCVLPVCVLSSYFTRKSKVKARDPQLLLSKSRMILARPTTVIQQCMCKYVSSFVHLVLLSLAHIIFSNTFTGSPSNIASTSK